MLDVVYRFRPLDRLLGDSKELERRHLYLALPQQLNDPMEGYKEVFWRGDPVLWENLLRHYVLSLLLASAQCMLSPPDKFEEPVLWASKTEDDLPTDAFRQVYHDACEDFLGRIQAQQIYERLTGLAQPLHRDGMTLAFCMVHTAAYAAVWSSLKKHRLAPPDAVDLLVDNDALSKVLERVRPGELAGSLDLERVGLAFNAVRRRVAVAALLDLERTMPNEAPRRKAHYLLFQFPDRYVQSIVDGLIHFPWRAACFTATITDAAQWAYYGENHAGVALVYRPRQEDGRAFLPLTGVVGTSSVKGRSSQLVRGAIKGELCEVTYGRKAPEIDFFQSLGTLPRAKLQRAWHLSRKGEASALIAQRIEDESAWKEAYWSSFRRVMTTKLEDWKHEEEYRIVQSDILGLGEDAAYVEYDFSCLTGVVFGLRTPLETKLEIMRQLGAMSARVSRTDLEFKQMTYDPATGRLVCT